MRFSAKRQFESEVDKYTNLLDHVPDDIILAVGSRDVNLHDANACIVGWIFREMMARLLHISAEEIVQDEDFVPLGSDALAATRMSEGEWADSANWAALLFGGDQDLWDNYFSGVVNEKHAVMEAAFIQRLDWAARRTAARERKARRALVS